MYNRVFDLYRPHLYAKLLNVSENHVASVEKIETSNIIQDISINIELEAEHFNLAIQCISTGRRLNQSLKWFVLDFYCSAQVFNENDKHWVSIRVDYWRVSMVETCRT